MELQLDQPLLVFQEAAQELEGNALLLGVEAPPHGQVVLPVKLSLTLLAAVPPQFQARQGLPGHAGESTLATASSSLLKLDLLD